MTLQWILVHRQPARTRVVHNFAIGGTSRPAGRGVGVGGGYILGLSHKRGVIFLKYPLPGRGKFFVCLNCLKITPGVSDQLEVPKSPQASPTLTPVKTSPLETRPVRKNTTCVNSDFITEIFVEKEGRWFLI